MIEKAAIRDGERLDDLQLKGLHIIQRPDLFCFGMDAVVLSDFVSVKKGAKVCDLCSGNGIIPLLLSGKTEAESFVGVELQKESYELAVRSVDLNALQNKISMINADLRKHRELFKAGEFDCITCNPPYMQSGDALTNLDDRVKTARHEVCCTLDDVFSAAKYMLKYSGKLFMVHRPSRLADIVSCSDKYGLELKRLQCVHYSVNKEPFVILCELMKGGNRGMRIAPPKILN